MEAATVTLCLNKLHEENIVGIRDWFLPEVLVSLGILAVQQDPVSKTMIITSEKTSNWWHAQDYVSSIDLETTTSAGQIEYCSLEFWWVEITSGTVLHILNHQEERSSLPLSLKTKSN